MTARNQMEEYKTNGIQCIQDTFASTAGVTCVIVDGYARMVTRPSNRHRFCDLFLTNGHPFPLCAENVINMLEYSRKTCLPLVRECPHHRLHTATLPILWGQEYWGCWIIGRLCSHGLSIEDLMATAAEIGLEIHRAECLLSTTPTDNERWNRALRCYLSMK